MKHTNRITLALLALAASAGIVAAQDGPPPGEMPPQGQHAPGGRGLHVLPPRAAEQLNLSDEQKQQIAALEAETKAKVEKILTPEQLSQLKQMRPPHPQGEMGRPGQDGPGQDGPGQDGPPPQG